MAKRKEFTQKIKEISDDLRRVEARHKRRMLGIDWGDKDEKNCYIAEARKAGRERRIPQSRRCPVCNAKKLSSRQWVTTFLRDNAELLRACWCADGEDFVRKYTRGKITVCKSCAMRYIWRT